MDYKLKTFSIQGRLFNIYGKSLEGQSFVTCGKFSTMAQLLCFTASL